MSSLADFHKLMYEVACFLYNSEGYIIRVRFVFYSFGFSFTELGLESVVHADWL